MRAIFSVDWKRMTSLSWHPLRRILTSRSRDSSGECLLNGQMRLIAFTNLSFCLSARTYRCSCPLVCMLTLIFVLLCYFICFTWIGLLCWPPSCSCYFDWRVMLCDVFFSMKITYCFLFCHEAGYGGWCSRSLILPLPWPWGTAYHVKGQSSGVICNFWIGFFTKMCKIWFDVSMFTIWSAVHRLLYTLYPLTSLWCISED